MAARNGNPQHPTPSPQKLMNEIVVREAVLLSRVALPDAGPVTTRYFHVQLPGGHIGGLASQYLLRAWKSYAMTKQPHFDSYLGK